MHTTTMPMLCGAACSLLSLCGQALADNGREDPYPPPTAPFHALFKDGAARCCIVGPSDSSPVLKHAAEPMRRYFTGLESAYVDWGRELSPFGLRWVTLIAPEIFNPDVLSRLEQAIADAEGKADSELLQERIRPHRLNLEYTRRAVHYLREVRSAFDGVDLDDAEAVGAARKKARAIGEPLVRELKKFCKDNKLPYPARRIEVHNRGLRYIIDVPDRKPILM